MKTIQTHQVPLDKPIKISLPLGSKIIDMILVPTQKLLVPNRPAAFAAVLFIEVTDNPNSSEHYFHFFSGESFQIPDNYTHVTSYIKGQVAVHLYQEHSEHINENAKPSSTADRQ